MRPGLGTDVSNPVWLSPPESSAAGGTVPVASCSRSRATSTASVAAAPSGDAATIVFGPDTSSTVLSVSPDGRLSRAR